MVYDWAILADLLKDDTSTDGIATYISYAKVNQYEKYKKDLRRLKVLLIYNDKGLASHSQNRGGQENE